jgi:hypothetical protein
MPVAEAAPQTPDSKSKGKITLHDVEASWPRVVDLLSPASQEFISKATPTSLEKDVLTFSAAEEDIDDVKARFKKDASIIRGFLESLHEQTFRFQIIAAIGTQEKVVDLKAEEEKEESELTMLEESEEYDAVDHVVNLFGGEVVDGN